VQWSLGATEAGSSGSPLFNGAKLLIGQLGGGWNGAGSSCDDPTAPDSFGRFDVTYPFIKKWIDPAGSSGPGPVAGTYYCLFYDEASGVLPENSGGVTVTTTSQGKFTGKLQMGTKMYPFSGVLDANGSGNATLKRRELASLDVQFQINLPDGADALNGWVTDGDWISRIMGFRPTSNKTNTSPFLGRYTLSIPNDSGAGPNGNGYGIANVDKNGRVMFGGGLSDGTKVAQAAYVSKEGYWPVYVPLNGSEGYLFGWLTIAASDTSDLSGQLAWAKTGDNSFAIVPTVTGSIYNRPTSGSSILQFTRGTVYLSQPDFEEPMQEPI
jgi:hypothetical protein